MASTNSEVEAGFPVLKPLGGNGMEIAFPKQHIVLAPHFDLSSVLGVEQHSILRFHRPDIGSYRNNLAPGEPAPDCNRRRNYNSAAATSLPGLIVGRDQHPIMQHPDWKPALVQTAGILAVTQIGHNSVALYALHDGAEDQQESN